MDEKEWDPKNNMLHRIIHRLFHRRHFWRHASFSEISELYAARMLRMIAFSLASAFLSVYLYQTGYSVQMIALFWLAFYLFACLMAMPLAALVAWIGPKHAMLWSNLMYIPAMIAFAFLPQFGPWLLVPVVLFKASSAVLYTIAFYVDFSKVKSVEHAGKEMAYMNIIEKFTTGLSPIVGGVLAFLFGPQFVLILAAVIFMLAALPLLRSGEPTATHQHIRMKDIPWNLVRVTAVSRMAIGFDIFTSSIVWWLFAAVVILGVTDANTIYAENGILMSVILFAALGSSYAYGKIIDHRRGRELLKIGVFVNALTHFARPFVNTPAGIAGLNITNEAATTGFVMAYNKGFFDAADASGRRIAFVGLSEVMTTAGAAVGALTLYLLTFAFTPGESMQIHFIITAVVVLLILTARFPIYQRK